jgi:cysteine desulfurase
MIYLDNAATTPLDKRVLDAMLPWLRDQHGNPSSDHVLGRNARAAVEKARAQVAALIGAAPDEIIWTSGATEANNLAIKGTLEFRGIQHPHVVTSRIEHRSVLDTCRYLETQNVRVTYVKPDSGGRVPVEDVLAAVTPDTALVSIMWVQNEIGTINDIETLAPQLRERGVPLHVDGVQATGRIPVNLSRIPVDLLTMTAHKLHGPKGVGALFVRKKPRARVAPQMHGSGHEQGMRSGTLATHQIVGMGEAFRVANASLADDAARLGELRDALWERLGVLPRIHRNGDPNYAAPHLLNVSFEGVEGESLRALLPGLAISSGSACSSATREPSYVLRALGREDELAGSSLRFSLGRQTEEPDIRGAAMAVIEAVERLRAMSPLWQQAA